MLGTGERGFATNSVRGESEVFEIVRHASVIMMTMIALAIMTSIRVRPAWERRVMSRAFPIRSRCPNRGRCPCRFRYRCRSTYRRGRSSRARQHLVHRDGVGIERDKGHVAVV